MFEISIVCHVFVFVVLADGWGFSLFGGCSGLSAVFSRVRGSSGFSLLLASLRFGRGGRGGGLSGVFSGSGLGAPGSCSLWGRGSGAPGAPGSCALRGGWARVRLVRAPCGGGGWVCLVSCSCSRCFLSCSRGVFRVFFVSARRFLTLVGGCRVGLGLFFSGCSAPGSGWFLVGGWPGFGFGFVWRV